jgi:SET domain-containing protein
MWKAKPVVFLMHTEMGYGVDFMMGTHKWQERLPTMNNYTCYRQIKKQLATINFFI